MTCLRTTRTHKCCEKATKGTNQMQGLFQLQLSIWSEWHSLRVGLRPRPNDKNVLLSTHVNVAPIKILHCIP